MKKYLIIIGNFGSGKTELALNIAFEAAETKKVTFVDLDIVNPYFRSTERKAELEAAGIRLLSPSFTNLGVEVPSLPAEIFSAFSDNSDLVIFDVGGDDTGAIALGQYHRFFSKIDRSAIEVLYVVNAYTTLFRSTQTFRRKRVFRNRWTAIKCFAAFPNGSICPCVSQSALSP